MAADLEQLVLTISADTRQMQRALQRLVGDTNTAAKQVDNAFGKGGAGKGLDNTAASATKAAAGIKNVGAVTADAGKLARFEIINLSRQIQDVGVSLIGGQSPFTVLAQQGSQIADIFGSSRSGTVGGAFKQIAGGIVSVITPMRLLAVGTVAAGVAAAASINSWKNYALQLDDTARSVGTTSVELAKLQGAAQVKGISADEFTKGISSFGDQVYQAQHNMGSLAEVFRANNVQASSFDDYLGKAANLIKNATSDQQRLQLLQQLGLPATQQWVRLLSGGADGIKAAKAAMAEFAADDSMVRKAREIDEALNRLSYNFQIGWRDGTIKVIRFFEDLSDKATGALMRIPGIGQAVPTNILKKALLDSAAGYSVPNKLTAVSSVDNLYKGLGTGAPGNTGGTVDKEVLKDQISKQQQYLGLVGQTMTAEEARRQVDLQVQAAALNGVTIDGKRVEVLKKLAEETLLGITAIKSQADAYRTEAQTAGMSLGQATAYTAAQNALNEARRSGRALTQDNIASINAEAKALGDAADAAARARVNSDIKFGRDTSLLSSDDISIAQQLSSLYGNDVPTALNSTEASAIRLNSALKGVSSSIEGDLTSGLADITTGAKSAKQGFADLASSVIRDIEQMIIKLTIVGPLMRSLQSGLGSLGLGNIFGSVGATAAAVPSFAIGGFTGVGGRHQAAGVVHRGEYVMDAGTTSRLGIPFLDKLRGYADGGAVGFPRISASDNPRSSGSGDISIVVNNNTPAKVSSREVVDGRGNRSLQFTIDDAIASNMSRPGSATRSALRNNFNASPVGVRR